MSETWSSASSTSESWSTSSTTPGRTLFSQTIFSHATHNSLYVFAFRNLATDAEGWRKQTSGSESWTNA